MHSLLLFTSTARSLLMAALVLAGPLCAAAIAGSETDTLCQASKLGAAGKHAAAVLFCFSKAAATGAAADSACLGKTQSKVTGGFAVADLKYGAPCSGEALATVESLSNLAAAADDDVTAPTGGPCASATLKAAGKFTAAVFKAYAADHKSPDGVRRDQALSKAGASLAKAITKAELNSGCSGADLLEPLRDLLQSGAESRVACIVGADTCSELIEDADADGAVTTDPEGTGPTATTPVTSTVVTPNAGTVVLIVSEPAAPAPSGFGVLGRQIEITAPPATVAEPLTLTFVVDQSLLPIDPQEVTMTRNGIVAGNCTGAPGHAEPDPCVVSRTILPSGDLEIVALTSHASIWAPIGPLQVCPSAMRMTILADTADADRVTEFDMGWYDGFDHVDRPNGARIALTLDCSASTFPLCDDCIVTGFDPEPQNCRCVNNPRQRCDEPFALDVDDCNSQLCECYLTPPTPVVRDNINVCLLERAVSDPTGVWNAIAGEGSINLATKLEMHINEPGDIPCPICVGDLVPNDGVQSGTCHNTLAHEGKSCDANGSDPTFPLPTGGSTSYDCLSGNIHSGVTIVTSRTETTGHSELVASFPCSGAPGELCHCDDPTAESSTEPNPCSDLICNVDGNGDGTCSDVRMYCDGILEEGGQPTMSCTGDPGCAAAGAGTCSITLAKSCFGSTIEADGMPDPEQPRTVSTLCVPRIQASIANINEAIGIPGPARTRSDWQIDYLLLPPPSEP